MEKSDVISNNQELLPTSLILTDEQKERVVSYFSLLIEIDQRLERQKHEHINKGSTDSSDKAK